MGSEMCIRDSFPPSRNGEVSVARERHRQLVIVITGPPSFRRRGSVTRKSKDRWEGRRPSSFSSSFLLLSLRARAVHRVRRESSPERSRTTLMISNTLSSSFTPHSIITAPIPNTNPAPSVSTLPAASTRAAAPLLP